MEHSELHLVSSDRRACRGDHPRLQTRFDGQVTCGACKDNIRAAACVDLNRVEDVPLMQAREDLYR